MTGRVHLRATHCGDHEVGDLISGGRGVHRSDSRTAGAAFVATNEHPQRAEAIAVRTNVLNGTARIEWAPHTVGYVD
jgi:hypothetical protein